MYDPAGLTLLPGWTESCLSADTSLKKGFFPFETLDEASLRRVMAMYYATISLVDAQVGRLIDELVSMNVYDDTMIVYTSDHGEYLGYHHMITKGGHMYDPLMRVPLIVKYPAGGGAPARAREPERLVSTVDIAPTILEAAGLEPAETMRGPSLLSGCEREHVYAERFYASEVMVRSRTRKLLLNADEEHRMYFDLTEDPTEVRNLYGEPSVAEEVASMRERALEWMAFETPTPIHRDETAPTAPALADRTPEEREGMKQYLLGKMAEGR